MKFFFANNYKNNTYIENLIPKNEFFWVLSWVKKVGVKDISKISFWDTFTMRMYIQKLIPFFEFYHMHLAITHLEASSFWSQKNSLLVYWKNKDEVMFVASEISRFDGKWIGEYLWYPDCCIKSRMDMEPFLTVYNRTKTFSYLLNDVSSYESIPEYLLEKQCNYEFTRLFQYFSGAFLTWTPCSYDCKESIEKLKVQENLIKTEDYEYYKYIYARSHKNILYFDKANWISFENSIHERQEKIEIYEGVLFNESLLSFFSWNFSLSLVWENVFVSKWWTISQFIQGQDVFYLPFKG
jgi:hypothetical protein